MLIVLKSLFYDNDSIGPIRKALSDMGFSAHYDFEKHRFELSHEHVSGTVFLRLPLTVLADGAGQIIAEAKVKYLMLLVQSGSASVGVFEGEKCLSHKVFSAYMVRKKQGKSQIKHLKTKGKSRAGSRVRLASTIEFFENINTRLNDHFAAHEFDRIALSCSKILIPYLFGSKVPTPFDKKDDLIYKIPKHLHQPNYEVMLAMQRYLHKVELVFDETRFPELNDLA